MTPDPSRSFRAALLTIAFLAASLLAYQVLLTRVCALRMHFHFGFLIISNSLLGIGASGSLLALFDRTLRKMPETWILWFSVAYLLSLPASWTYLLTAQIPDTLRFIDAETGTILWGQTLQFAGFNLACAVPFFFGGLAIGLILTVNARRVHSVYAADLLGAGLGCLLCPALLWDVGAGGCFLAAVVLGMAACAATTRAGPVLRIAMVAMALGAGLWMPSFDQQFPVPGKKFLDLTSEQSLAAVLKPVYSRWSPNSRIDVLPVPRGAGPMPNGFLQARGKAVLNEPLPQQLWIAQDGDAGTMLTDFASEPEKLDIVRKSMYSTSFALQQGPDAKFCIIGVGGAPDVWAASIHEAALIRGIELNEGIIEVHETVAANYSRPLWEDDRIEIICGEGRNELMRTEERFDVIQLTGIDTWTALNSGAYVLAENYLYTVEACRTMIDRLTDDGTLQITRMAAGMETIRLMNNMLHGLPEDRRGDFANMVAAFRAPNDYLICVALKKDGYSPAEAAQLREFATTAGLGMVYMPDATGQARVAALDGEVEKVRKRIAELNKQIADLNKQVASGGEPANLKELEQQRTAVLGAQHNLEVDREIGQFLLSEDKAKFVDSYPFDISPTTDDRPYFFSFIRWSDPDKAEEYLHQPTWVVQGNPLFLRNQLLLSAVAALLFILMPLLFRRGASGSSRRGAMRFGIYFSGLGAGFIGIEVALIQKFTLLLGLPLYSIVVTLCSILIFTGIGSFFSRSLIGDEPRRARLVPMIILGMMLLLAVASPWIVEVCIGLPMWARSAVVVLLTAPIGFMLGIPFAHGIRIVEAVNPSFVPWAWAVNGCTTVIGSLLTVILSMNFGFAAVMLLAALVYIVSFAAIDSLGRSALEPASEVDLSTPEADELSEDGVGPAVHG
ncbi:MAG: hypothetical protein VYE77_03120 [Planctomycetota bacterium]|nr:hypothetical protein [Planctomycetota bacterium]